MDLRVPALLLLLSALVVVFSGPQALGSVINVDDSHASEHWMEEKAHVVHEYVATAPGNNSFPNGTFVPLNYNIYRQCNSSWANDLIYNQTVCEVGCLMSSISMALNGHQIQTSAFEESNPGSLNAWLRANHGYNLDNELIEDVIVSLSPDHITYVGAYRNTTEFTRNDIVRMLQSQTQVVIANVMHGEHFVLVVGFHPAHPDMLFVNDPGFHKYMYWWENVVGWRIFNMTFASKFQPTAPATPTFFPYASVTPHPPTKTPTPLQPAPPPSLATPTATFSNGLPTVLPPAPPAAYAPPPSGGAPPPSGGGAPSPPPPSITGTPIPLPPPVRN
eukprot:TRINITY_DN6877_c0_g1_i3.p1 TRINITY_DN6877_c0_g1~~TRINITY_DN6877_c0_g1_i3.p1  ORF type:complete len:332 (-),score=49.17 TRINITY_DN6877_c0_g1_i3:14-1009(-)